jgi:hypothetical protein
MKDLRCGQVEGFPTWTFWGETTVQFVNYDTSGATRIDATYQAGGGRRSTFTWAISLPS